MIAQFVYGLHPITQAALLLSCNACIGLFFVFLCRRFVNTENTESVEVKIGMYTHAFGLFVAVFFSLVIVTEWTAYTQLTQSLRNEISNLNDMYNVSELFNENVMLQVHNNLKHYVSTVIADECKTLYMGIYDSAAELYLLDSIKIFHYEEIIATNEELLHRTMGDILANILHERRVRIFNSESSLSSILWGVIIACNIITLFILALAARGSAHISIILQTLFSLGVGFMLLLIVILNKPFYYGTYYDGHISARPFQDLLDHWDKRGK